MLYNKLACDDALIILHDVNIYQSMLHKTYRELYLDFAISEANVIINELLNIL